MYVAHFVRVQCQYSVSSSKTERMRFLVALYIVHVYVHMFIVAHGLALSL